MNFAELAEVESGKILLDEFDEGARFLIMRGPASLCAYVGVPMDHPLAGFDYDDLPVNCHGGLTFSREGKGENWPSGFWWYGWDYAHCGDRAFYDLKYNLPSIGKEGDKEWTVEEVKKDSWHALYDFKKLIKLAERIKSR